MHILVTGAAGMIGRKLVESFARQPQIAAQPITQLTLADVVPPPTLPSFIGQSRIVTGDIADVKVIHDLVAPRPDVIFHLAAVVSGEAERDFEKGYRVNLAGTQALFEAIRLNGMRHQWVPRVVYASSNAVFGGDFPDVIPDNFHLTPQTSYGVQKAIGELLLQDYSRKGFFDGIGIRLPTISVRPGRPNAAASGFFSGIIREPLVGQEAILPVSDETRHWMTSPRSAIGFLRRAAALDTSLMAGDPNLSMPALSITVGEQIAALKRVAGEKAVRLIRRVPDAEIEKIVLGWARGFDPQRAIALGFTSETSYDEVIRAHIEDELGGEIRL